MHCVIALVSFFFFFFKLLIYTAWTSLTASILQLHFQYCISKKSFKKSDEKIIFINSLYSKYVFNVELVIYYKHIRF